MTQNINAMKRLIVENFQSHQRTVIDFAPAGKLTIIIGRSRSGKTAIIRALRWLLYNDPRGVAVAGKGGSAASSMDSNEKSGYCRVGASFIRVTLEMESGHTVIRERTASTNRYKIIAPGASEPLVLEGFGDSVPLEIQEITGVRPVRVGDTELNLNLSEQLDGPFMGTKSMSAPARAKVLGKLAGTEEIDSASKTLGTDLFRRNNDKARLAAELVTLDDKIVEYDYLPAMGRKISELEQLVVKIKVAQERREKLAALKERLADIEGKCLECQGIIQRWHCLDAVEREVGKVEAFKALKQDFEHKRDRVVTLEDYIADCTGTVDAWQGVEQADSIVKDALLNVERRRQVLRLRDMFLDADLSIGKARLTLLELEGIDQAADIANDTAGKAARRQILSGLLGKYKDITQNIDAAETILARLAGVDEAEQLAVKVTALKNHRNTVNGSAVELKSMDRMVKEYREQAVLWENRVAELEGAYNDDLVSLGVCPLCNNVINPKKLKEAV